VCRTLGRYLTKVGVVPVHIGHFGVTASICVTIEWPKHLDKIPIITGDKNYPIEVWCGDDCLRSIDWEKKYE
jgi:hypothetical protein